MKRARTLWQIVCFALTMLVASGVFGQSMSDYQKVIEKQDKLELMLKQREPIHTHTILIGWTIAPIMNGLMGK